MGRRDGWRLAAAMAWGAIVLAVPAVAQDAEPAEQATLRTRWADLVPSPTPWPEYPRPQLVREDWLNLNGEWGFALTDREAGRPASFDRQIRVPFPPESQLSNVQQRVTPDQRMWYRRTFDRPADWRGRRVLLHFGAVDWEATVWVNGQQVGSHRGGYDAFCFDITDALTDAGTQELVVSAWDPTDAGGQPVGKQRNKPRGIRYTPTSGIWQTVWLEPVPELYIEGLRIVPDLAHGCVRLTATTTPAQPLAVLQVRVRSDGRTLAQAEGRGGEEMTIQLPEPVHRWSLGDPFLYNLDVEMSAYGHTGDRVASYFGMRDIALGKDEAGVSRLLLNGEPVFQVGLLDQGFWPDGLYTAPTDEALRYDIEMTKRMGFNLIRKHVKVEPARWYWWCDQLGVVVWQDMPDGANRTPDEQQQFRTELERMVRNLWNHPCIVMWVPFNEGWGQHETAEVVAWLEQLDPSRLVNGASGWHDRQVGAVHDIHAYPGPAAPKREESRAGVLGEFGGLGLRVPEHMWADRGWGYAEYDEREQLATRYEDLFERLYQLHRTAGLAAAVYTQTTDVETETNGLLTYDRAVLKIDEAPPGPSDAGLPAAEPRRPARRVHGRDDGASGRHRSGRRHLLHARRQLAGGLADPATLPRPIPPGAIGRGSGVRSLPHRRAQRRTHDSPAAGGAGGRCAG